MACLPEVEGKGGVEHWAGEGRGGQLLDSMDEGRSGKAHSLRSESKGLHS